MTAGHGGKKTMGAASQGKGSGSGANTIATPDLGENQVLSNRDKARHSDGRGQDSKAIQTDQRQDHAANRAGRPKSADDKGQNIAQNTRNQGYQQDR